ncbi:MAG: hypothetical protein ACM3MF_01375 [Anaerolineae bacterium]
MDKMDRLLRQLPSSSVPEGLAASIRLTVRRRHLRRLVVRRSVASVLGVLGLWMLWPALAWLSSGEPYASTASWLAGGLDYLNYGSLELITRVWSGAASLTGSLGSALEISVWVGALLLCAAIFLLLDLGSWQPSLDRGDYPISARSLHV